MKVLYRTRNEEKAYEMAENLGGIVKEELVYSVNDIFVKTVYEVVVDENEKESN